MRGGMTIGDPVIESGTSDIDYHTQESPFADDGTCLECGWLGKHDAKCPVRLNDSAESRGAEEKRMNERFSKATLARWINARLREIERQYNFDPSNGTSQLEPGCTEQCVAYGEWDALRELWDEFNLPDSAATGYR